MQTDSRHPLAIWIERKGLSVEYDFAPRCGYHFVTIYALMRGAKRRPGAGLLEAIQTATGGEVTITEMLEWQRRHGQRESA